MLQSIDLQRVGHDGVTEQTQIFFKIYFILELIYNIVLVSIYHSDSAIHISTLL